MLLRVRAAQVAINPYVDFDFTDSKAGGLAGSWVFAAGRTVTASGRARYMSPNLPIVLTAETPPGISSATSTTAVVLTHFHRMTKRWWWTYSSCRLSMAIAMRTYIATCPIIMTR
ncbi:hypothetical protein [Nonomuraea sp. NPDC049784]|uniref:hypothetical protein n=1 Tax=Nonomuraea sp. NPDC049784 TaxID=3154361 RepID=UPI0033E9054B